MEDVARTLEVWVARTPPASEDLVRLLLSRAQTSGTHSVSKGEFASLMLNMVCSTSPTLFYTSSTSFSPVSHMILFSIDTHEKEFRAIIRTRQAIERI